LHGELDAADIWGENSVQEFKVCFNFLAGRDFNFCG